MLYNYSAKKDIGKIRSEQQDDVLVLLPLFDRTTIVDIDGKEDTRNGALFVVADGMGGGTNGALASQLAVEGIKEYFILNKEKVLRNSIASVNQALIFANTKIREHILQHEEDTGMGSTLVLGLVVDKTLHLGWVGDSRCYTFDTNDRLTQISKDHSYVQTLVDENKITREQAFYHPKRNIITQSLGMESLRPSVEVIDLSKVSFLLFCSDGLTSMLPDDEIQQILSERLQADLLNARLVDRANDAGGEDNISSILVQFLPSSEKSNIVLDHKGVRKSKNIRSKYYFFILLALFFLFALVYAVIRLLNSDNDNKYGYLEPMTQEHFAIDSYVDDSNMNYKVAADSLTYYVRINVFPEEIRALDMMNRLQKNEKSKEVKVRQNDNGLYEVCVFGFADKDDAVEYLRSKNQNGGVILYQN